MSKEIDVDCRKYRKSTHLASVDLDVMRDEGKALVFTIKQAWYETNVNVSGKKTDGYFCRFNEHEKDMVLNSTNRLVIAEIAKDAGFKGMESYNVKNWGGLVVLLYVDPTVTMMKKTVGGIRIKEVKKQSPELTPEHKRWEEAKVKVKTGGADIDTLRKYWTITQENFDILCL